MTTDGDAMLTFERASKSQTPKFSSSLPIGSNFSGKTSQAAAMEGGLSPAPASRFEGPSLISRIVTQNRAIKLRCSVLLMTQSESELQCEFDDTRGSRGRC